MNRMYRLSPRIPIWKNISRLMKTRVLIWVSTCRSLIPGVYFTFVESHVMEHGLYMLAGRGIYWLNRDFIEVQKDDFIYMAPFCPQFYYATGWEKSAYLLYKDVNRDYTAGL